MNLTGYLHYSDLKIHSSALCDSVCSIIHLIRCQNSVGGLINAVM